MTEARPRFLDSVSGAQLIPHPDNLRADLGEWKELAGSIKANGVLTRLVVQPHPTEPNVFEILAGHRRHKAGTSLVPPAVFPVEIKYDLTEAQVQTYLFVENLDREKLTPSEEALGYSKLIGLGTKMPELVKATGRSKSHIQTHLNLLECPPEIRRLVDTGDISMGDALRKFRGVPNEIVLEYTADVDDEDFRSWDLERLIARRASEDEHQALYDRLIAAGDRVETDPGALPEGSVYVIDNEGHWSVPHNQKSISVDPKAHQKEACHLSLLTIGGGYAGDKVKRYEICTDPSNHKVKGKSGVKTKARTASDYEKAVRATERESNNRYLAALQLAIAEKDKAFADLMLWGTIDRVSADGAKVAAMLFGLTKDDLTEAERSSPGYGFKRLLHERAKQGPGALKFVAYACELGPRSALHYGGREVDSIDLAKAHGFKEPTKPNRKDFAD